MTIRFDLAYSDVLAFSRHYVRTSTEMRRSRWIYSLLGPLLFSTILFVNRPEESNIAGGVIGLILFSGIYILLANLLLSRLIPVRMAKQLVNNRENANLIGYREMTFSDDGIESRNDKLDVKMDWNMIVKLGDTQTHFLLYTGTNQAYIVPKQAMAAAEVDELTLLLNNQIKR